MRKIKLKFLLVWLLVFFWLFSGWPPIWPLGRLGVNKIRIPPKIQEAQAAAPAFQAASAIGASTTGDFTITLPAHQANDIFLAISWVRSTSATVATPAGWILMTGTPFTRSTVSKYYLFWKRAAGSSETNPLFDTSGTDDHYAMVAVYRGVIATGDPFNVSAVSTSAVDPSLFTGITTLTADSLVVAAVGGEDNNNVSIITTATNPADFTEHYLTSNIGADGAVSFNEASRVATGATGNVSVNWVTAVPVGAGGIVLALKPVPNNPPSLTVSQPDGVSDTVVAGQSYNITYDLSDAEDVATVDFYYDSNSSGLDGTAITGCQDQTEGTGATCSWNTTGMTAGDYYVYGIATDGVNPDVNDYSSGVITIQAAVVSVSVSDGNIVYSFVAAGGAKSTLAGEANDMQVATNDGNVTETFNIKGQNAACPWTLAATAGNNQYIHQFCNDTDYDCTSPPTNYTALTTSYQTLDTGIAQSGTVNFQLRITVPTETSCYTQQTVDVTIQAVQ